MRGSHERAGFIKAVTTMHSVSAWVEYDFTPADALDCITMQGLVTETLRLLRSRRLVTPEKRCDMVLLTKRLEGWSRRVVLWEYIKDEPMDLVP